MICLMSSRSFAVSRKHVVWPSETGGSLAGKCCGFVLHLISVDESQRHAWFDNSLSFTCLQNSVVQRVPLMGVSNVRSSLNPVSGPHQQEADLPWDMFGFQVELISLQLLASLSWSRLFVALSAKKKRLLDR